MKEKKWTSAQRLQKLEQLVGRMVYMIDQNKKRLDAVDLFLTEETKNN